MSTTRIALQPINWDILKKGLTSPTAQTAVEVKQNLDALYQRLGIIEAWLMQTDASLREIHITPLDHDPLANAIALIGTIDTMNQSTLPDMMAHLTYKPASGSSEAEAKTRQANMMRACTRVRESIHAFHTSQYGPPPSILTSQSSTDLSGLRSVPSIANLLSPRIQVFPIKPEIVPLPPSPLPSKRGCFPCRCTVS